ncbi:unnamed protein product [Lepeophtheirus salmonis]|uniref:(salmon louse) hypothetical protein n=1 Tax=Lepeophtheirus salmonis TaxID=72036 RepID=A0A817FFL6_LEPSM|nr:unnamed protein product [Lepeophtheirus salmonis]CAG9478311.1 unnamed protein product [Lepeophtheirus salmonis]
MDRVDRVRRLLEAPYIGPAKVISRTSHHYVVELKNGNTVSIERLKPPQITERDLCGRKYSEIKFWIKNRLYIENIPKKRLGRKQEFCLFSTHWISRFGFIFPSFSASSNDLFVVDYFLEAVTMSETRFAFQC